MQQLETLDKPKHAITRLVNRVITRPLGVQSLSLLIIFLMVVLMIGIAFKSLDKPLIMDEMEFPAVAQAIKETGRPVYYRSDVYPSNVGLWHPPLYIGTLALWQVFFSSSSGSNRTYGLFNACLAVVAIGLFVIRRWNWLPDKNKSGNWSKLFALVLGLAIAASSPLLIQGSILPDIDTQVLPLLITAGILGLFELRRRNIHPVIYGLTFIVVLVVEFFAKLTTSFLLLPAFMVYEAVRYYQLKSEAFTPDRSKLDEKFEPKNYLTKNVLWRVLRYNWRGLLIQTLMPVMAGLVALAAFIALWFLIAAIWAVPFDLPFLYLTQSSSNPANYGGGISTIIAEVPKNFSYFLQWIGLPPILTYLFMVGREFFKPINGVLLKAERCGLYVFLLLLSIMYVVLRPAPFNFPKYWVPLIPIFALLVLDWLFSLVYNKRFWLFSIVVMIELVIYWAYILYDSELKTHDLVASVFFTSDRNVLWWNWMVLPAVIFSVVNIIGWFNNRKYGWEIVTPVLLALLVIQVGYQSIESSVQAKAAGSTTYYYGEQSLDETVDYLRATVKTNELLIAPKDVGTLMEDHWRYYELNTNPLPYMTNPNLNINYLVFRENDYYGHQVVGTREVNDFVNQHYKLVKTVRNFMIYKKVVGS